MLWLAGGPGCSTLRAFFYEIGPFNLNYANCGGNIPELELNPYSWTKVANIIFVDAPVGAGFSYAKKLEAYKTSDSLSATQTNDFLKKWLKDHPKFINNPLYIAGVSYSGIVIPIIVQEIYNGNEAGLEPLMNIKGYLIGNPLTDKNSDVNSRVQYAHRLALLSDKIYESAKSNCYGNYINVDPNNTLCVNDLQEVVKCLKNIYGIQILEPVCSSVTGTPNLLKFYGSSPEKNATSPLQLPQLRKPWCREDTYVYSSIWANDETVQKALHIRKGTITEWKRCDSNTYTFGETATTNYQFDVSSCVGYHRNLTYKNCGALIFSGDHDMVVPYLATEKWIRTLNLTVRSSWSPWFVEDQVAGYVVALSHSNYSLTFATVKGAGHAAPEFKPKECLAMVDRWFGHHAL